VSAREITVEIGSLVLDGFSPSDGDRFASALTDTLTRHLEAMAGTAALTTPDPSSASRPAWGPAIEVDAGQTPQALGARVAEAIGRRLLS
jgi:hypothetical protein